MTSAAAMCLMPRRRPADRATAWSPRSGTLALQPSLPDGRGSWTPWQANPRTRTPLECRLGRQWKLFALKMRNAAGRH
eukprot:969911-Alexandrium_andersonii.AAC.1